jgi:hypothetical protein
MKQLIVLTNKIPNIKNATICTYEEEYQKYLNKCKTKIWRTPEGFSLNFNSTLKELKNSVFIYPDNENVEAWIKKFYKVIEENIIK